MIASTQIRSIENSVLIVVLVFKLLSRKVMFINITKTVETVKK